MNPEAHERRVLLATWVYAHHNPGSGYAQLCHHLDARCLRSSDLALTRAPEGSLRWNVGRKLFDGQIFCAAMSSDLVHFLYAENHLRLLYASIRTLRVKRVGTVHLPLDYYSLPRSVAALACLDGIVTLTSGQADEVRAHLPDKQVRFIPHGCIMDHPYGRPDAHREATTFNVAVVGSNYRDWDTLTSVLRHASEGHADWRFHLVGLPPDRRNKYGAMRNAVVHNRLAEPDYYDILNRSHALFMPLTFATANNALLEAHSVGLPSVCTDLPAVRDYAVSTTRLFRSQEEAMERLRALAEQAGSDRILERTTTAREGAAFDWPAIARQVRAFHDALVA